MKIYYALCSVFMTINSCLWAMELPKEWGATLVRSDIVQNILKAAQDGKDLKDYLHTRYLMTIDYRDQRGNTALHYAAQRGDVNAARRLMDAGAQVNAQNSLGDTPLYRAAMRPPRLGGSEEMVRLLLRSGAQIDLTPYVLPNAVGAGNVGVVSILLDYGAENIEEALRAACRNGDSKMIALLNEVQARREEGHSRQREIQQEGWISWIGRMILAAGGLITQAGSEGGPTLIPRVATPDEAAERQASSSTPQPHVMITGKGKEKSR